MLIELPRHTEIFGSVKIHELQRVLKLDSGGFENPRACDIAFEGIKKVLKRLAIIVPIKNENIHLLEGVLRAIPFDCSVIVVSNSARVPQDIYKMEKDVITNVHNLTQQEMLTVHQKDPELGFAFHDLGYDHLLDSDRLVRDGKAEGMIIGMLLAKALGKDFIGFADADNYIPGSVREYVMDYAAGFCMSESPYSMVRLHWRYKPKVVEDRLYFKKWGRVSETTNKYLNLLLSTTTGFETRVVITGNAGEHALTMKLADIMSYSTGYSIEPFHFVYLFDEFGLKTDKIVYSDVVSAGIEVFQIETLNPHIHEEKGEEHIKNMLLGSLSTIYNSKLCNDYVRQKVLEELVDILERWEKPPEMFIMPPIGDIDAIKFAKLLNTHSDTFLWLKQGIFEEKVDEEAYLRSFKAGTPE
ncbi:MAG: mannosyl-3-phosphoglycerate synthase [Methanophagales archaeon]|nr:mannosyl-3-phosphoglycerate synthase [Methanophagales archaeon]MCW3139073.1 mannosyl-3-phosphoglycerate synthase [Methanophagales archaeon]MCW7069295.1 mannosyl-3-phosphoglycerate synthase [Methanophagales archaeon]MCW7072501.1 mannosyl-3-phosphoglycerate synthase [Methanophagales archaeon]